MTGQPDHSATRLFEVLRSVLGQVAEPSQLLKTMLAEAVQRTHADRGVFVEVSSSGQLSYRVLYKFQKESLSGRAGDFSRHVLRQAMESGKPILLANALSDPRFMSKQSVQDLGLVSVLCVPIQIEGRIEALIHMESDDSGHFDETHQRLMESLIDIAGPALGALRASEGVFAERDALRRAEESARTELEQSREILAHDWSFGRFVGCAPIIRELEDQVQKTAKSEFPVLIQGETGTGKNILARVLHHSGLRAKKTLVTVFCPSLEKGMVESELFGHKRGAFTGADSDRTGKVQLAEGGTLFLDEIGELPLDIQPKLLRLLQEKTYERIGDPAERKANVRVIAATNRNLPHEVDAGHFRRDLYERLNFVSIRVPPLRERVEDIPLMLDHCLKQNGAGRWIQISDEARQYLRNLDFAWPGNVRHIEQIAARLAVEGPERPVGIPEIEKAINAGQSPAADPIDEAERIDVNLGLPALLAHEERKWLKTAMDCNPGMKRSELAGLLKISEATLFKKLKLYKL